MPIGLQVWLFNLKLIRILTHNSKISDTTFSVGYIGVDFGHRFSRKYFVHWTNFCRLVEHLTLAFNRQNPSYYLEIRNDWVGVSETKTLIFNCGKNMWLMRHFRLDVYTSSFLTKGGVEYF